MMFLRQWKGDSQGDFGVVNGILEQKLQQQREKKKHHVQRLDQKDPHMIRIFSLVESFLFPLVMYQEFVDCNVTLM